MAAWMLLAVFVPILLLSSIHIHETGDTITTECNDCVLCQFLTLTMLAAAVMAVTLYVHVCIKSYAQPLCGFRTYSCGNIVTRGPPTL